MVVLKYFKSILRSLNIVNSRTFSSNKFQPTVMSAKHLNKNLSLRGIFFLFFRIWKIIILAGVQIWKSLLWLQWNNILFLHSTLNCVEDNVRYSNTLRHGLWTFMWIDILIETNFDLFSTKEYVYFQFIFKPRDEMSNDLRHSTHPDTHPCCSQKLPPYWDPAQYRSYSTVRIA